PRAGLDAHPGRDPVAEALTEGDRNAHLGKAFTSRGHRGRDPSQRRQPRQRGGHRSARSPAPATWGRVPPRLGSARVAGYVDSLMPLRLHSVLIAAVLAVGSGCTPEIGDECQTAIDCSTLGDRLCDTSQPGGYCTVFNCEPDTCEDEAVCVAFANELDPACQGVDDGRFGRFGRTFCMRVCDKTSDCRSGYECVRPVDRRASVIDVETDADNPQDT